MKLSNDTLKIAIQKKGRLTDDAISLLQKAGLDFDSYENRIFAPVRNFNADLLFVRDDDIPEYVEDGVCDLGIVGLNIVSEKESSLRVVEHLGFGKCQLSLAVPKDSPIKRPADLAGKRVASSYPRILRRYLESKNIQCSIIELSGSVEIAPALNVADAICDLVSSGSTLRTNGLVPLETVFISEAVLVQNKNISPEKAVQVTRLLTRIRGVMQAKHNKYIALNAPASALPRIREIIPGLLSPTVVSLATPGMVSIQSVVSEDRFWEVIEQLNACGASGIVVLPVEKMIV